jgi:hypothetical protein
MPTADRMLTPSQPVPWLAILHQPPFKKVAIVYLVVAINLRRIYHLHDDVPGNGSRSDRRKNIIANLFRLSGRIKRLMAAWPSSGSRGQKTDSPFKSNRMVGYHI